MKKLLFIAFVVLLVVACSEKTQKIVPVERTVETQNLLHSLKQLESKGQYMFGHEDDPCYGVGWVGDSARSDVKSVCGDMPAVLGFSLGHIELGHELNLDGVPFSVMREEIIRHFERGGVTSLTWHLDNPLTGNSCWAETEEDGMAVEAVLEGGEQHGKFLKWLDRVADFINSLKTADGVRVPVLFRPWHEQNASWFWFGQDFCTPEQYKELWRMTVERLNLRGVSNALYAYSPTAEVELDEARYLERYPGDDQIDVMGMNCYCFALPGDSAQIDAYSEKLDQMLAMLCDIAKKHDKAAVLTEAGYEGIPADNWWTHTLAPALRKNHVGYVLVWRNAHDKPGHFYAPYPGHPSANDFVEFYKLPETLFCSDIDKLY
jgi:mannan endo-1,4-beta-mannosidase